MMIVKEYDTVLLKDGRRGTVVELNENSVDIEVGTSPSDWEILWFVPISDIEKVISTTLENG